MPAFQTFSSAYRSGNRTKPARAWITPLSHEYNDQPINSDTRSLQYFPESVTDSKVNGYQAKEIPGLSHPLYQWTAGGARELSFTAVFSADLPPSNPKGPGRSKELQQRSVDVDAAVAWIQSYQYPEYSKENGQSNRNIRPKPPRKMILTLPNMLINLGRPHLNPDEIACILVSAEVSRESFFPSGATRLAKVDLSFAEIIQLRGSVHPHDAYAIRKNALSRYTLGVDDGRPSGSRYADSRESELAGVFGKT